MLQPGGTAFDSHVPMPLPSGAKVRNRSLRPCFGSAFGGILISAVVYACLLGLLAIAVSLYQAEFSTQAVKDLFGGLFMGAIFFCVTLFFFLLIAISPLALVCLSLSTAIFRSLDSKTAWHWIGGTGGGLTGFIATCSVLSRPDQSVWGWYLLGMVLGPGLATVLGQIGGCWAALEPLPKWQSSRIRDEPIEQSAEEPQLQFGIRQLLIATTWLAVVMTVLKLIGGLGVVTATVFFVWFAYQAATLQLVVRQVKRFRGSEPHAVASDELVTT